MNDEDDGDLIELAGAVLDGTAVDWEAADARAVPVNRTLVSRLRQLADIAQAHREGAPGTWGPLRLLERIGQGTSGQVYRAWDPRLDREVALKLSPAEPAPASRPASAIIEEGRLLARVRHPNVVTIHGAEQIGDRIGLWMEYIDGRTLHDLVACDGRRFSPPDVEAIGRSLCGAVAAVHGAGLLHRDITARNVMLGGDGRVVLMDFGSGRDSGTAGGEVAGTPLYLAPEILAGTGQPSARSDVYSIGVLLYFLLTGTYPVTGADLDSLRAAHGRGDRRSLKAAAGRVPRRLRGAVECALDPDPERRQGGAAALAAALGDASRRRSKVTAAAAAAVLLVGVLLAARFGLLAPATDDRMRSEVNAQADLGAVPRRDPYAPHQEDFKRAWALAEREGVANPVQAAKLFASLIASDPAYAPAHAGLVLANAYLSMTPYQGLSFEQAHAAMRRAALESLRLDAQLAEAHVARAWVHAREFEWAAAERAFREAIRLNPRLTAAYVGLSLSTLQPLGREAEAEALLRDAQQLAPVAESLPLSLGRVLFQANRPAEAIAVLEPSRRTDSDLLIVDLYLGRALALDGRVTDALPLLERRRQRLVIPAAGPEPWVAWAYVRLGRRAEAEKLARDNDHLPFRRAVINAALGKAERMFDGLEEMSEHEPQRLPLLLRAPELAGYREDPRFRRLVDRLRLGDARW